MHIFTSSRDRPHHLDPVPATLFDLSALSLKFLHPFPKEPSTDEMSSSSEVFRRVGRGGAGNWYSKKDIDDANKVDAEVRIAGISLGHRLQIEDLTQNTGPRGAEDQRRDSTRHIPDVVGDYSRRRVLPRRPGRRGQLLRRQGHGRGPAPGGGGLEADQHRSGRRRCQDQPDRTLGPRGSGQLERVSGSGPAARGGRGEEEGRPRGSDIAAC